MENVYNATTIANEFLGLASADGRELTPMQVIKLTYIAHGWSLALLDRPLIENKIEAWRYGPVIPDLYRRLNIYGRNPIAGPIKRAMLERSETLDENAKSLISQVFGKYGALTGIQLSNLTHRTGTPWAIAYRADENNAISNEVIKDHYASLKGA